MVLLQDLHTDMITIICQTLSYCQAIRLKYCLKICDTELKDITLFKYSILFHKPNFIQNALAYYDLTEDDLYNIIIRSTFKMEHIYNVLWFLDKDIICNDNKHTLHLQYQNDEHIHMTEENIIYSIKLIQIILSIINNYFKEDYTKDRHLYHYFHVHANDILINYFSDIIKKKYHVESILPIYTRKFRLATYENKWYKSNFNLYLVFLLYLVNLEVINIIRYQYSIPKQTSEDNIFDFIFNFITLFNFNEAMAHVFHLLCKYISDTQSIPKDVTGTLQGIYDNIMNASNISANVKNMLTNDISGISGIIAQ